MSNQQSLDVILLLICQDILQAICWNRKTAANKTLLINHGGKNQRKKKHAG